MASDPSNVAVSADEPDEPQNVDVAPVHEADSMSRIKMFHSAAREKVPEIGEGRRWYDLPYSALYWLLSSWRRKALPRHFREKLSYVLNYLHVFNEHDRHKAWSLEDPLHNVVVPNDEHVNMPGVWVVELFPPSQFAALEQAIERNSWDKRRRYIFEDRGNRELLARSRSEQGWTWWRLAEIAAPNTRYLFPDGTREKLPPAFSAVELMAVQIGVGLTAVVGYFHLTDSAASNLDTTWHARHEPQLVFGKGRPRAEDRMWATFRITQQARRAIHDAARDWMGAKCPGFFAANGEPQLLMDMLLMDKFDPIPGDRIERGFSDALRALGLTEHILHRASADLPNILLHPVEGSLCPALEPKRTWTLWGNREAIASADGDLEGRGSNKNRAIAHAAHDRMKNFLVMLTVSEFLAVMEAKYAELRDSARTRHGAFRARGLRRLRESFLTLSLDLTSAARDVDAYWQRKWRHDGEARFNLDYAPWIVADDEARGGTRFTPIEMNDELRDRHHQWFQRLVAVDRDYRDILSTVASLGASVDTFKIGRVALVVALASLFVALVTLLVTDVGGDKETVLGGILSWAGKLLTALGR